MSLRFHEIAESNLTIQNPLNETQLVLLGQACNLKEGVSVLDLGCGKGEPLVQWANHYSISGVGVDISPIFISDAQHRAYLKDVGNRVNFIQGDAVDYPQDHHQFDVVSCFHLIGNGLNDTIDLMRIALRQKDGVLVIGGAFWSEPPTEEVCTLLKLSPESMLSLGGMLDKFEVSGFELVEMVLASQDNLDRYETSQWQAINKFIEGYPDDPEIESLRKFVSESRRSYLYFGRRYMGWGAFVLKDLGGNAKKPPHSTNPNRPVGIEIANEVLWVRLSDGRVIGNPLEWYPWLRAASSSEKDDFEFTATGITWHSLKRYVGVSELLSGKP